MTICTQIASIKLHKHTNTFLLHLHTRILQLFTLSIYEAYYGPGQAFSIIYMCAK